MKKLSFYLIVFFLIFTSESCERKNPLNDLQVLASELETNSSSYTASDWENAFSRYEEITASLNEKNLNSDQTRELGRLNGVCTGYLAKGAIVLTKDAASTGLDFLGGFVNGIKSTIDEGFIENSVKSFGDKLESLFGDKEEGTSEKK